MKDRIRNMIDNLFSQVHRDLGLKQGDITPDQEMEIQRATKIINKVMKQWTMANK